MNKVVSNLAWWQYGSSGSKKDRDEMILACYCREDETKHTEDPLNGQTSQIWRVK